MRRVVLREVVRALGFIALCSVAFFFGILAIWKEHPGISFAGVVVLSIGLAIVFVGLCAAFSTRWRDGWK